MQTCSHQARGSTSGLGQSNTPTDDNCCPRRGPHSKHGNAVSDDVMHVRQCMLLTARKQAECEPVSTKPTHCLHPCLPLAALSTKPSTWAVRIKSSEKVAKLKDLLMKLRENPKAEGIGGTDGGWDAA
eukprot:1156053-Pelagomonas_calceolata.AAC.7